MRLWRETLRRAKSWLALNLSTVIKDKKNVSIDTLAAKGSLRRISILFLDGRENIMTKGEEKSELLNAFFASVFNSRSSWSLGTTPWAGRWTQGAEWRPHNPQGNGQWPALTLTHSRIPPVYIRKKFLVRKSCQETGCPGKWKSPFYHPWRYLKGV